MNTVNTDNTVNTVNSVDERKNDHDIAKSVVFI